MKKIKFCKPNFKKVCMTAVMTGIMLTHTFSLAVGDEQLQPLHTEEFINWQSLSEEEKQNTLLPRTYTTLVSEDVLEQYGEKYTSYREQILTRNFAKSISDGLIRAADYNSPTYNLNTDISVEVKHQGNTNECWAFSVVSSLETNLELNRNIVKRFSSRHMDYSTAKTFTDGINPLGYNREVGDGGLAPFGLAYLTNGQGAVLESEMPFEDNEEQISISELAKEVDTIVTGYVSLPAIYKEYAPDTGEVIYTNGGSGSSLVIYEDSEVEKLRNMIKNHIVEYGAVAAVTAGNQARFYNNANPFKATAYFCNDNSIVRDHAITIVGWDDNYSKDNFTGVAKPTTDGAYIILNSYGTESFNKGYMHISYEDALIETLLYGIKSTSDKDYDRLYQYNPMGDNSAVGIDGRNEGYLATIYNRDVSKDETLSYVGVSIPDNVSLEIYVNPNGNSTIISGLTKVAETEVLEPGYHRIPVTPTKLNGNTFAIVVKQKSTENRFYFSIETGVNNSLYETITGNPGKTLFSYDGYSWKNLSTQSIVGLDMTKTDLCIKAFTDISEQVTEPPKEEEPPKEDDEPEVITFTSKVYKIEDVDVYKIEHTTTLKQFLDNIETNSKTIEVYDKNNKKVQEQDYVKTGMTLKLSDGKTYKLIVRGDLNGSGTLSLVDLSKLILHYNGSPEFILQGDELKAADLSCDGRVSLMDISQMITIYNYIV